MQFSKSTFAQLATAVSLLSSTALSFNADSKTNRVLYWGQSDAQKDLSYYCENDLADILVVSFIDQFSNGDTMPTLDVGSGCSDNTLSNGMPDCSSLGKQIKTCQNDGKIVLLSLGGQYNNKYGLAKGDGSGFADLLWSLFGGSNSDTTSKPFGDAVIDGFDLDIEGGETGGYIEFVNRLRTNYESDSSKTYYVSSAPQCPLPDEFLNGVLTDAVIDFAFIQFYNNYCSVDSDEFNFNDWIDKASSFKNQDMKLFLGVLGAQEDGDTGYATPATIIKQIATNIKSYSNFGGIMMWDAASASSNQIEGLSFLETFIQSFLSLFSSLKARSYTGSDASSSISTLYVDSPTATASTYDNAAVGLPASTGLIARFSLGLATSLYYILA